MSAPLTLTLPGLPPTANTAYRGDGRTGRRLTAPAQAWRDGAALLVRVAATRAGWVLPPRTPWRVTVLLRGPRCWAWDVDNRVKLLGDCLQAGLGGDDRYIVEWRVRKQAGPVAQTEVTISLEEEE